MKVALCLYGALREFSTVRASLQTHVFPNLDVDVFACVWGKNQLGLYPSEAAHPCNLLPVSATDHALEFFNFGAKKFSLSSSFETSTAFQNAFQVQKSRLGLQTFLQFPLHYWANLYAQETAVSVCQEQGRYDHIIVSRADVVYLDNFLRRDLRYDCITVNRAFGAGKPSDFWYAGPSEWCHTISKRFSTFPKICPSIENHPLTLFQNKINDSNFPIFFADLAIDMVQRRYTGWWWTPYVRDPNIAEDV